MADYSLFRSWGTHGDMQWGTYQEMKAKYESTFVTCGLIPSMNLSHGGEVIRSIGSEWRNPESK